MGTQISKSSYFVVDYYVIVFDLCSSSIILEDLQNQERLETWKELWEKIFGFLKNSSEDNKKYVIYKFLGDGFILLFDPKYENELIEFCNLLCKTICKEIKILIDEYLNVSLERIGITAGVEKGELIKLDINNIEEYTGKAINIASRLQASLKEPEHVNKLLISKSVKRAIVSFYSSSIFKATDRKLHNLFGEKRFYCFEVDLSGNNQRKVIEDNMF
jgi:class 3 adenylate cyclase